MLQRKLPPGKVKRYCSIQSCINFKGSSTGEYVFFRLVEIEIFSDKIIFTLNASMFTGRHPINTHTTNGKRQLENINKFVIYRVYVNCTLNLKMLFALITIKVNDENWKLDPYQPFLQLNRKSFLWTISGWHSYLNFFLCTIRNFLQ